MLQIILMLAIICIAYTVACVPERLATQITQFPTFSADFKFLINERSKHANPATNQTISSHSIPMVNDLTQKQMVIISFI